MHAVFPDHGSGSGRAMGCSGVGRWLQGPNTAGASHLTAPPPTRPGARSALWALGAGRLGGSRSWSCVCVLGTGPARVGMLSLDPAF